MSALTGPRSNTRQSGDLPIISEINMPIEQSTICHQGGMCGPDGAGFCVPAGVLGVAASVKIASTSGGSDGVLFTAIDKGTAGNGITVQYLAPGGGSTTVSVTGKAIVVQPQTSGTNAQVVTAVQASAAASALVSVAATVGSDQVVTTAATALTGGTGNAYAPSVVVGVSEFEYDNSGTGQTVTSGNGAQGALNVQIKRGTFKMNNSTSADLITQANVFQTCYAVDDQTVALTSSSSTRPVAGLIIQVDSDGVWVELTGAAAGAI